MNVDYVDSDLKPLYVVGHPAQSTATCRNLTVSSLILIMALGLSRSGRSVIRNTQIREWQGLRSKLRNKKQEEETAISAYFNNSPPSYTRASYASPGTKRAREKNKNERTTKAVRQQLVAGKMTALPSQACPWATECKVLPSFISATRWRARAAPRYRDTKKDRSTKRGVSSR